ncbi:hypothetical protein PIB30_094171 [Stylosanthes scabra]|uniref:Uncharacterized protein n=1 Tax=Stylosanthes scabra TaxID=79078 RepID=A0ABU6SW96_9FABA|nr:hypothetical protein [Stylosanthes scabra]
MPNSQFYPHYHVQGYTRSTSLVYHARLTHALTNPKPYLDSNAQSTPYAVPPLFEHPSTTINLMISKSTVQEQARTSPMMLNFWKLHKMRRGGDKLRVAANGASIGAPDQKLSRPEAADE